MTSASLRPVAGTAREVFALLRDWLTVGAAVDPLVVRTSGSSGLPKDVVLSREALLASARATHHRLGGPGRWMLDLPVHHVAGLQVLIRSVIAGSVPVVAAEHGGLPAALAAVSAERTYVSLVPTQLHRLAESGLLGTLARCEAVLVGGAFLSPRLAVAAGEAGVRVVRTYGMSETGGGCVYDGVALDGVGIKVDGGGQVHLAGPMLFERYDNDPEATKAVFRDGWFATADLGELDADGRLRVLGRGDDVVISGGVNVSLPAVTDALTACIGVRDAVAVGIPDDEWGARVVACVVGTSGVVPLTVLRDAVESAGLPRTWGPRDVVTLERLPLLASGKVDRVALRAAAAAASTQG